MSEEIKIEITATGTQAVAEIDKSAAAVRRSGQAGTEAKRGLDSAAAGFKGLVGTMQRATTLFGAAGVIGGVFALIGTISQLIGIYKRLTEVNREYAAEARKAADVAKEFGLTAAGLDAVRAAADEAGVPAAALNEKLKEYKDHKTTFDDLAAAVGKSADELQRMQDQAARRSAGTAYLAELEDAEQTATGRKKARKIEKAGLRAATETIRRGGPGESKGWDVLFDAAGGEEERVAELYNRHASLRNRTRVGVLGFGTQQLPAGRERWESRQAAETAARAAAEEDREFWIRAERDAEDAADYIAGELEVRERLAAEEAAAAAERQKWLLASHTAEMDALDRETSARADAAKQRTEIDRDTTKKIDNLTFSAPSAASTSASIGGITGGVANNAARLADQRAAAVEAIQREQTRLLAEIKERLGE